MILLTSVEVLTFVPAISLFQYFFKLVSLFFTLIIPSKNSSEDKVD
jgi:hypothetical protein